MLNFLKPSNIQKLWAATGDKTPPPDDFKIAQGFVVEVPTLEDFNYLENKQDAMLAHINQYGVVVWDNVSDYLANKSYVQGSDGIIYHATDDSVGVDPVTDTSFTYWKPAYYDRSEVYTKAESDGKYLSKSSNLADLTNNATARANLGVFSLAESVTNFNARSANLSDVTNPTTAFNNIKQTATEGSSGALAIATYSETNAGTVTDKAVTPQKLRSGISAVFATNGYIVFPNWFFGIVIRWGTEIVSGNGQVTSFPPIAHSTLYAVVCSDSGLGGGDMYTPKANIAGTNVILTNTNSGSQQITWYAIGK